MTRPARTLLLFLSLCGPLTAAGGAGSARATAPVAADPATPCFDGSPQDSRPRLLSEINRRRAERGLGPLRFSGALCRVAEERAVALARRGDLTPDVESLGALGQATRRANYRPARLFEATIHGRTSVGATIEALGREQPEMSAEAVAGDLLDAGIGFSILEGKPLAVFLFALPSAVVLERQLAPFADLEAMRQAVLAATNRARRTAGVLPLARDPILDRTAQAHAEAMRRERFYAHLDPEGREVRARLRRAGHNSSAVGENLARGLFSGDEVVERWLLSSGHRENILSPLWRSIGIGVSHDPRGPEQSVHWVQVFSSAGAEDTGKPDPP